MCEVQQYSSGSTTGPFHAHCYVIIFVVGTSIYLVYTQGDTGC
jgi:hypothetical protein